MRAVRFRIRGHSSAALWGAPSSGSSGEGLGKVRPRRPYNIDLGAHLARCDSNYSRILRLLPALEEGEPKAFRVLFGGAGAGSGAAGAPAAIFEVLTRDRYTSVVALSQHGPGRGMAATRIVVRLYHDARCAEVIEFQGQRRFASVYTYPNEEMRQPDEKAQVNRFLTDFLNFCLTHGRVCEEQAAAVDSNLEAACGRARLASDTLLT